MRSGSRGRAAVRARDSQPCCEMASTAKRSFRSGQRDPAQHLSFLTFSPPPIYPAAREKGPFNEIILLLSFSLVLCLCLFCHFLFCLFFCKKELGPRRPALLFYNSCSASSFSRWRCRGDQLGGGAGHRHRLDRGLLAAHLLLPPHQAEGICRNLLTFQQVSAKIQLLNLQQVRKEDPL